MVKKWLRRKIVCRDVEKLREEREREERWIAEQLRRRAMRRAKEVLQQLSE